MIGTSLAIALATLEDLRQAGVQSLDEAHQYLLREEYQMREKEFIEKLKAVPYPKDIYASLGLDDDFVAKKIAAFNPPLRNVVQDVSTDDPLIRLIIDYDASRTEIGMIWFSSEVTETDDYYYVGKFELDRLCISKFSHEVVVLPYDDPLSIMYKCAQNSFLFLDAVIEAAKFLTKRGVDKSLRHNQSAICAMAEHCSQVAGGRAYVNFYQVLLGCFS